MDIEKVIDYWRNDAVNKLFRQNNARLVKVKKWQDYIICGKIRFFFTSEWKYDWWEIEK